MQQNFSETLYPATYRAADAKKLGEYIASRHTIEIVGMKRVGISNFLRYFLYHPSLIKKHLADPTNHIFISVDLYDLVEKELFAFWILTFKRLLDQIEVTTVPEETRNYVTTLFMSSIQTKDLFLTIDNLRRALTKIVSSGVLLTFFFIRFDRMNEISSEELFANFQGIRESTGNHVSYIFTSFRPLESFIPQAKIRNYLSIFESMYIKPASELDMEHVYESFEKRYHSALNTTLVTKLIQLAGGHVQYLQIGLLICSQKKDDVTTDTLFETMLQDERITLLSQEIIESLLPEEITLLRKVAKGTHIDPSEKEQGKYLFDTGILSQQTTIIEIFSPLLKAYLLDKRIEENETVIELSKKEHLLYNILLQNIDEVCERERILDAVWPEYEEFGVSDWTIDRLIARLRAKLKQQQSNYAIVTIKTRGYKLVEG